MTRRALVRLAAVGLLATTAVGFGAVSPAEASSVSRGGRTVTGAPLGAAVSRDPSAPASGTYLVALSNILDAQAYLDNVNSRFTVLGGTESISAEIEFGDEQYSQLSFMSDRPLTTGVYHLAGNRHVQFDYSNDGNDYRPVSGTVSITAAELIGTNPESDPIVKYALTFAIRAIGDPRPIFGAFGYDTGALARVPGPAATVTRAGDFDGDGISDIAVYRPSTGQWLFRGRKPVTFGRRGDVPVVGDYSGDGVSDIAVFRPSTGQWLIRGRKPVTFGRRGDVPVVGDYNGDGVSDIAVYRPSTGQWFVRGQRPVTFGRPGDVPVVGDYNGDGISDIAVYRPSTRQWFVRGQRPVTFGGPGDIPVPAAYPDFDGNPYRYTDQTDIAVYRPRTGIWNLRGDATLKVAGEGGIPVPGDFATPLESTPAVYHPSTGVWAILGYFGPNRYVHFGRRGDIPV